MCNSLRLSKVTHSLQILQHLQDSCLRISARTASVHFSLAFDLNSCFVRCFLYFSSCTAPPYFFKKFFPGPNEGFIEKMYRLVQIWLINSLPIFKMFWYRNMNFPVSFVDSFEPANISATWLLQRPIVYSSNVVNSTSTWQCMKANFQCALQRSCLLTKSRALKELSRRFQVWRMEINEINFGGGAILLLFFNYLLLKIVVNLLLTAIEKYISSSSFIIYYIFF